MIKNYFKIGWRNLTRNKTYAAINIIGLSLGIACSILIFTIVSYHLSFEDFNHNKDRIYRIVTEVHSDNTFYSRGTPSPMAKAIRDDYSFTEKAVRVAVFWKTPVNITASNNDIKKFNEDNGIAITTSDFFDIFNFPLEKGNIKTALVEPNTAIITEKLAKKYFGDENAMGKIIRINNAVDVKVTGILKDLPLNTDRTQEIYVSDKNLKDFSDWQAKDDVWGGFSSETNAFLLLKPGVTGASVEKVFPQLMNKYYSGTAKSNFKFKMQPLNDIHFNPDYEGYADKKYLWAAAFIGLFLIITACVNFINLATAQALNRSKEIGIRKVLGSKRQQLFWQFIAETTLITLFATTLAFELAQLSLPMVNNLFKTQLIINPFVNLTLLAFIAVVTVVVIFLSGSYPGLILSGFKPIAALKGKLTQKNAGGFSLRRSLVITQFTISQLLIIGTIIIASQMRFSKDTDLGFTKNNILMLPIPVITDSTAKLKMKLLANELKGVAGVQNVSLCMEAPGADHSYLKGLRYNNKDVVWGVNGKAIDENYLSTFNLKLVAGRDIYSSDTINQYIVNETFVKKLGLQSPQEMINKNISVDGVTATVVGVVKDFHDKSFHVDINPVVFFPAWFYNEHCAVQMNMKNIQPTLSAIEKTWSSIYPQYAYNNEFLDTKLAKYYELDDTMLKLIEFFSCIAILIGCLGLYGLVSFMALQKTKEIGVRKVLGARVASVLWLFGKEFSSLLLIAFLIAAPAGWWLMNKYLQDFKYRINIGAGVFLLAISITFIIAAITVGYRSVKAALANPVKSLRTE
jgi:putative ABC transport system permease protein